jgi:N-acetylglucosaminyldiphosphoundecaprenol N-acetyl-beta-D-mannosaminyltransferase
MVCTPNVDDIAQAQRDQEFRDVLNSADLAVADGMGVVYASRLLGTPLPQNVGGRPLLIDFCQSAAAAGYSIFFLGSMPGIAEKAAERLKQKFQGLVIAGTYSPPYNFERIVTENEKALSAVVRCRPDAMFVALGSPRQQKWIRQHLALLNVPVCVAIGSSFDVISGHMRRAPVWMTEVGMEWLFRLVQEPRRLWKRYLVDAPTFAAPILGQSLKYRLGLRRKGKMPCA